MPTSEEVAAELDKIENERNDLVGKYCRTISENIERAKLRVKSVEEHLNSLKENYNYQRDEATKSLNDANLVLASLEAAHSVLKPTLEEKVEPVKAPARRRVKK